MIAGTWFGGRALAATDRRFSVAATSCVVFILGWFYLHEATDLALRLIAWDDWVFFERIPLYFAILLLLMMCIPRLRKVSGRWVACLGALFWVYTVLEVGTPVVMSSWLERLDDSRGPGQVNQSTGWSCGAAALAWAMRLRGIPASERQMAELALTAPLRGTKMRGMLRAAHRMGVQAEARRGATWEQLVAAPKPALAGWKLSLTVGHVVVVIRVQAEQITVGDPLLGEVKYTRDEFLDRWDRDLVAMP